MITQIIAQPSLALVLLVCAVAWLSSRKSQHKLPPGPRGIPFLGNFLDIPKAREWLKYEEWGRKYGSDLIHLRIMGVHLIVVNSTKAAQDLFEKRSSNYSDKLQSVMVHELTGWGRNIAFMGYGDWWRAHRRMFHEYFRPNAIPTYHSAMIQGVRRSMSLFQDSPDAFVQHLRFLAGSTVLDTVYGIDPKNGDDPRIKIVEEAVHIAALVAGAGAYLVDYFPILKYLPAWLPGAEFKRQARGWKPLVDEMFIGPYRDVKSDYDRGNARPCVLSMILDSIDKNDMNDELENMITNVTGIAYAAGTDTTVATLAAFIEAMVLFPDMQAAAQSELDLVLGGGRLPELGDQDSLPYISALLKEVMRWRPILPLGIAHRSIADDEYNGYHIPAGSIVVGNVWTILHEEDRYPEPYTFNPRRFLGSDGQLDPNILDPTEAFGFSRRICAGRYYAHDLAWLAIATILTVFKVEKPVDDNGMIIEPSGEWTSGLICFPKPFKAAFKPRSAELERLIRDDAMCITKE